MEKEMVRAVLVEKGAMERRPRKPDVKDVLFQLEAIYYVFGKLKQFGFTSGGDAAEGERRD
jgi:hypothetical protein